MEVNTKGGRMHTVEIAGYCYAYKNITQLNELIHKRLETLAKDDAHHTERMLLVRNEKKAIARYLGVPMNTHEPRMTQETRLTSVEALSR